MLRDGKFIREEPIKIGSHYVPPFYQTVSKEDQIIQDTIMGEKTRTNTLESFDVGIYIIVFYVLISIVLSAIKLFFTALIS